MLFPDPAAYSNGQPVSRRSRMGDPESRTFSMNPEKGTLGIPSLEGAAKGEPHRGSISNIPACIHLIFRWVRRGQPASRVLVQAVTCKAG